MARDIDTERFKALVDCDICHGKRGHNREIYHVLSFAGLDQLRGHLNSVFPETKFCVEFYTNMWITAHQLYGHIAKDKYMPLWLVYLEAHGVEVKNRGESIMKHRERNPERPS